MKDLIVPTPNLNGNSADNLVDKLREVLNATSILSMRIGEASDCWHGRNFQTLGPDEGYKTQIQAQEAWRERIAAVDALHKEVLDLAVAIQERGRQ